MAKNKVVLQGGQRNLVDAEAMGIQTGWTPKHINRLADDGVIPWHGFRSGGKTFRRYNPEDVLAALAHRVNAQTGNREVTSTDQRLAFSEQVDYWTGRLTVAIGAGSFRDEVGRMLNVVMNEAYERGQSGRKLNAKQS